MSLSSPQHDAGPSQSSPPGPDFMARLFEIQQQLPPGVTLTIQAPPLAHSTVPTGTQAPPDKDLPALLGHLTAGEVRYLAMAKGQDVIDAIDQKELKSHKRPHGKHQISVEDALAWIEKRKTKKFLDSRTLAEVWQYRQDRSRRRSSQQSARGKQNQ